MTTRVVLEPVVKKRVESLQIDFHDVVGNCDSPKLRSYLDKKLNNKFRSSENQFYQTQSVRSPLPGMSKFANVETSSQKSSHITKKMTLQIRKRLGPASVQTKLEDQQSIIFGGTTIAKEIFKKSQAGSSNGDNSKTTQKRPAMINYEAL